MAVEHRAESRKLVFVEIAGDGFLRVLGDVSAGVGDVLAKFAPPPSRLEHGALRMSKARLAVSRAEGAFCVRRTRSFPDIAVLCADETMLRAVAVFIGRAE